MSGARPHNVALCALLPPNAAILAATLFARSGFDASLSRRRWTPAPPRPPRCCGSRIAGARGRERRGTERKSTRAGSSARYGAESFAADEDRRFFSVGLAFLTLVTATLGDPSFDRLPDGALVMCARQLHPCSGLARARSSFPRMRSRVCEASSQRRPHSSVIGTRARAAAPPRLSLWQVRALPDGRRDHDPQPDRRRRLPSVRRSEKLGR